MPTVINVSGLPVLELRGRCVRYLVEIVMILRGAAGACTGRYPLVAWGVVVFQYLLHYLAYCCLLPAYYALGLHPLMRY
jgi:hypothetical protein